MIISIMEVTVIWQTMKLCNLWLKQLIFINLWDEVAQLELELELEEQLVVNHTRIFFDGDIINTFETLLSYLKLFKKLYDEIQKLIKKYSSVKSYYFIIKEFRYLKSRLW